MEIELHEINVTPSENQKKKLSKAFHNRETIKLRLSKDALSGSDTLRVPSKSLKRLEKKRNMKKGMEIKLDENNIRKQVVGSLESKGMIAFLDYSSTKDFITQNIEKLIECGDYCQCESS